MDTLSATYDLVEAARQAAEELRLRALSPTRPVADIHRANIEWARAASLVTTDAEAARARAIRTGRLATLTLPHDPLPVIQLSADLVLWLYLFDDAVGEAPAQLSTATHRLTLRTYEETVRSRRLPDSPTATHLALLDLVDRAVDLGATQDWLDRFATDLATYFSGCLDEGDYRRRAATPSVVQYRELRARSVGTRPVFAVKELGVGGVVPRAEIQRDDVVAARELAGLLTAWVNDIYSFPKELGSGDPLNLVIALAREHGLSYRSALLRAVEHYNAELGQLESELATIRATSPSNELLSYLEGLLDWVHGNRVWTASCGRYQA